MWRGGAAVRVVAIPWGFVIGADRFATRDDAPQVLAHAFQVLVRDTRVMIDRSIVEEISYHLGHPDTDELTARRLRDALFYVVDSRGAWRCDVAGCIFEHVGENSDE